jgi:hypothetical protein
MKDEIFVTPYSSGDKRFYTYWALKNHFKLIADQPFTRGDTLKLVNIKDNVVKVVKVETETKRAGYFITLPPIDSEADYEKLEVTADVLLETEIVDEHNKVVVVFAIFDQDSKMKYRINEKEEVIVSFQA